MYMALSRFATGIKIDDLCTMSTQHTNCNLIGALYCVLINDIQLNGIITCCISDA